MPRKIAFLAGLSGVSILILGVIMFNLNFTAEGANPRIHKKELPEHGLIIVNSTDETYESDVNEWIRNKNSAYQELATTLKPYSVFVRNTSDRDILAYKLNWELKMSDGRIVNFPRTYFTPDYLMGVPRSDLYDSMMGSIKKNGKRFYTMIPTSLETDDSTSGTSSANIRTEEIENFQDAGGKGDIRPLLANITGQANQATDITVSIDSVLFDDGEFVGPSDDVEFIKLKSYVAAKHDLLKIIKADFEVNHNSPSEILTKVVGIANQDVPMPSQGSNFGTYYNFFRKLHAQEIKSSSLALGDDAKTVKMFMHRLDHKWIIPHIQN